jgi:hypothetical protein
MLNFNKNTANNKVLTDSLAKAKLDLYKRWRSNPFYEYSTKHPYIQQFMMHKSGGTIAGTSAQEQLYVSI